MLGAKFEAELAGGVALWDVSDVLPKRSRPEMRDVSGIQRVYVHHSGALGKPGLAGIHASARYATQDPKTKFPCFAYHYWVPAETLRDEDGRLVVLRGNRDETRAWHTGGAANGHGVGVVLQGNTTARPLTESHVQGLQALLPWLRERHELSGEWLSWHADSGRFGGKRKVTCPGMHAEAWLRAYREAL